jgi:hypothetical protein
MAKSMQKILSWQDILSLSLYTWHWYILAVFPFDFVTVYTALLAPQLPTSSSTLISTFLSRRDTSIRDNDRLEQT